MKTPDEMKSWMGRARLAVSKCRLCRGADLRCMCNRMMAFEARLYEACVPEEFWHKTRADVWFNTEIFDEVIVPYMAQIVTCRKKGIGIFLEGPNGCGKSMFLSMVAEYVLRGTMTAYYTSMPVLAHDISEGFRSDEIRERLEAYMTSDFVIFDEVGKENWKSQDSFVRVQVERWVKERWVRMLPTLWASNSTMKIICRPPEEGGYGETLRSLVNGRCLSTQMDPGDQRGREGDNVRALIWKKKPSTKSVSKVKGK